jgi:hypothetical protein
MLSWDFASLLAMITGLVFIYDKTPTFGGFKDYLGLAAWAIGFDQAKNLTQMLQSWVSSSSPKA